MIPNPTPPYLGEREAVARTDWQNLIAPEPRDFDPAKAEEQLGPSPADEIARLRTENETLREENQKLTAELNEDLEKLLASKCALSAAEDDREAALARLETALARGERAEEEARDARYKAARYKADCEEIDEHGALSHAEEADAEIDRLTAKLAQAEGEIATMREALKPFVTHYEPWMDAHPDGHNCSVFARITFGDLRRARALTSPEHPHGD